MPEGGGGMPQVFEMTLCPPSMYTHNFSRLATALNHKSCITSYLLSVIIVIITVNNTYYDAVYEQVPHVWTRE